MVSEAASENPRLFQEHAHVAQFRELRLGHTAVVSQATSPFHEPAPSSVQAGTQLFLAPIHPSVPWPLPGHPEAMKMSCRRDYFHTSGPWPLLQGHPEGMKIRRGRRLGPT